MDQNIYFYDKDKTAKREKTDPARQARFSLILGLLSLLFFCIFLNLITALISIIKGARALRTLRGEGRMMAVTGIAASLLSIALFFGCWSIVVQNTAFLQAVTDYMTEAGAYDVGMDTNLDSLMQSIENEGEEL